MEKMSFLLLMMQSFLALCQICIMLYAFKKFLSKPKNDLLERLTAVEIRVKDIEMSLHQGNDNFRMQKQTNEVLIHSTMALIEFEIQYCLTEKKQLSPELQRAKDDLQSFLSRK